MVDPYRSQPRLPEKPDRDSLHCWMIVGWEVAETEEWYVVVRKLHRLASVLPAQGNGHTYTDHYPLLSACSIHHAGPYDPRQVRRGAQRTSVTIGSMPIALRFSSL